MTGWLLYCCVVPLRLRGSRPFSTSRVRPLLSAQIAALAGLPPQLLCRAQQVADVFVQQQQRQQQQHGRQQSLQGEQVAREQEEEDPGAAPHAHSGAQAEAEAQRKELLRRVANVRGLLLSAHRHQQQLARQQQVAGAGAGAQPHMVPQWSWPPLNALGELWWSLRQDMKGGS